MKDGMTSRFRPSIMAVLLGLALVLIGVLALQAYRAEEFHQDTAGTILQDYAELGAEELASRVTQQIDYYGATPLLSYLGQSLARDSDAPLPTPEDLLAEPRLRQAARMAVAFFVIDLRDGEDGVMGVGGTVVRETQRWVSDTVLADIGATSGEDWRFRTLFGSAEGEGEGPVIMYTVAGDPGEPIAAFGVLTTVAALGVAIDEAVHRRSILPTALTRGAADSATAEIVSAPGGRTVYRSSIQYPSAYVATVPVAPHLGGMTVTVTIAPAMANTLIIGGAPTRRLPMLIALFALGVAMIVAAMVLWRREQTLARLRIDFVSGVSHELRTPLAQIRMFAETLQLGRVRSESERRRSLEIIDQETRRLTHLVENLLYFSRSESNASRVEGEPCDLGPVVSETVNNFAPLAAARNCEIDMTVESGTIAWADPDAIRQMVLNLLDNAVKYGPDGQVIRVVVEVVDGGPRVVVEDQGSGIPASQRASVWQRFWRSEGHHASAISGTGIGLAIVKELAELQGARVWTEPGDGGGARFVISWPSQLKAEEAGTSAPMADDAPPVIRVASAE
jgi:signal transduction histidine kinase